MNTGSAFKSEEWHVTARERTTDAATGEASRQCNPVIPGFNPDPSIARGSDAYYVVTSSFEYLPGIPVYRSTDLQEWHIVGNVIERPEQLDLSRTPVPGGVWAPTIRFHEGLYYVIVSVMFDARCLLFTAHDPRGPWSDPKIVSGVDGIDPDLVWGDDGTAYVTFARMGTGILQAAVDLEAGRALEQPRKLWSGSGMYAPEGPHIYRRDDGWILLVAEGGTERGHAVSAARGDSPEGPFVGDPTTRSSVREAPGPAYRTSVTLTWSKPQDGQQRWSRSEYVRLARLGRSLLWVARPFSPVDWIDGWPRPRRSSPASRPRTRSRSRSTVPTCWSNPDGCPCGGCRRMSVASMSMRE